MKKQVTFKEVPVGTEFTQVLSDARIYSFRKVRVPVTYIDRDYEGDDEMEAARGMGDCADFYYPVGDDEICTIDVEPPHEIVVRPGHFEGKDGFECPACSVISTERGETDDGRAMCSVCGYVAGDVPVTPSCIII